MSRFSSLKNHLPFAEAVRIYFKIKSGNRRNLSVARLQHPFSLRNNPHDYGTFEEVIVKEGYKIDAAVNPKRIIDGGGNIGLTAAYFASRYPDAQIITIEPDKENFELLSANVKSYQNIKPLLGGVWSNTTWLQVKDLGLGNNGFIVEEVAAATPGAIRAWSIAGIMEEMHWDHCDIVKLDVEGSEKEIFEDGYQNWLPKTALLIIELHDRMKKGCSRSVFTALNQYDFSMEVAGENLVFTNETLRKQ